MIRPIALLWVSGPARVKTTPFSVQVGMGLPISACSKSITISPARAAETTPNKVSKRYREAAIHVISRPRIVPVDEANLSSSKPMRWSIETKRFGSG